MRSIAEMSPDVGRAVNLSGPSMVKSAGLPDELPASDGELDDDAEALDPELEAQAAMAMETTASESVFSDDDRFTESSGRRKLARGTSS